MRINSITASALLVGLALLTGCQNQVQLERIQPGMSRQNLLDTVGDPKYVASTAEAEYFWYDVKLKSYRYKAWSEPHYVKLTDGTVESYGKPEQYPVQAGQFVKYDSPDRMGEWIPSDPSYGRMSIRPSEESGN